MNTHTYIRFTELVSPARATILQAFPLIRGPRRVQLEGDLQTMALVSVGLPVDGAKWYQREGCQNSDENFSAAGDPAFSRPRRARAFRLEHFAPFCIGVRLARRSFRIGPKALPLRAIGLNSPWYSVWSGSDSTFSGRSRGEDVAGCRGVETAVLVRLQVSSVGDTPNPRMKGSAEAAIPGPNSQHSLVEGTSMESGSACVAISSAGASSAHTPFGVDAVASTLSLPKSFKPARNRKLGLAPETTVAQVLRRGGSLLAGIASPHNTINSGDDVVVGCRAQAAWCLNFFYLVAQRIDGMNGSGVSLNKHQWGTLTRADNHHMRHGLSPTASYYDFTGSLGVGPRLDN
ncbi:hypothetical protein FA13DRAFT_1704951 [Coprinellus micaceus]|uniref:Uncharacterized protein n=1 Tax=Coprinellus micaceus TaxID=71717 RepID=A0A4Y7TW80_COPMI|nr:hypothetical protein FA13DRAFT_1704951 [Coprinellus micaceus]